MDREAAQKALVKLAQQTAATWQRVRGEAFLGDTTIETANTTYHFKDGAFSARAPKPAPGAQHAWESPPSMRGIELIGFLSNDGGLWSLSPRWREGSFAVMTTHARAYTLTSPTLTCVIERKEPVLRAAKAPSNVLTVPSPPPTLRRPAPPSMTRLQLAPPTR